MSVVENGNTQMLVNSKWQVDPALSAVEFRARHLFGNAVELALDLSAVRVD
jgi:hypothetical protein